MSEKICASLNHVASKSNSAMVVQEYEIYCSTSLSYILPNQTKKKPFGQLSQDIVDM